MSGEYVLMGIALLIFGCTVYTLFAKQGDYITALESVYGMKFD